MGFRTKAAPSVASTIEAMEGNRAQRRKLRHLMAIFRLLRNPGPAQAEELVTTQYGSDVIPGRPERRYYETHHSEEPDFARWRVRWYWDDETIFVFDVDQEDGSREDGD